MKWKLCMFLLPLSVLCAQEEFIVQRVLYVPQVFYVGDTVEMRVQLRELQGRGFEAVQYYEQPSWGEIVDIDIANTQQGTEVRITFVSYEPGTLTLPMIILDDMALSGLSVYVPSILDVVSSEEAAPMAQLLLPYTVFFVVLMAIAAAVLPLLGIAFWKFVRARLRALSQWHARLRPLHTCKHRLHKLHQQAAGLDEKDFYFTLTQTLRSYLIDRISPQFLSATSREIGSLLRRSEIAPQICTVLEELFHSGDLVKFAHLPVSMELREQHLSTAQTLAQTLQKDLERQKTHDRS